MNRLPPHPAAGKARTASRLAFGQPPLKVSPYFWGNRLHGDAVGSHRAPLGACLEQWGKSLGEASRKLVKTGLYNRSRAE